MLVIVMGDCICIINVEGGQCVELIVVDVQGWIDIVFLGVVVIDELYGLCCVFGQKDVSLIWMVCGIVVWGIDLFGYCVVMLFGGFSFVGDSVEFIVSGVGWLIVVVLVFVMLFEIYDMVLFFVVQFQFVILQVKLWFDLFDLLVDLIFDLCIFLVMVSVYLVWVGEYIQVLDVDGW